LNGSDFLEEVSGREFRRRLNAMPEGGEVVIMAESKRSRRAFPVDTSSTLGEGGTLILRTDYNY
jgi:hypothetical protein